MDVQNKVVVGDYKFNKMTIEAISANTAQVNLCSTCLSVLHLNRKILFYDIRENGDDRSSRTCLFPVQEPLKCTSVDSISVQIRRILTRAVYACTLNTSGL